jgi:hypothetical protein
MQKIAKSKQPKKANKPPAFLDPNSPMLAPGTPNDGTVDEYAVTVQNIIKVHCTADMPMKIPGKGRMIVSVVDWPALRHVLNVLFGPGEKTEETLTYKPPAIEQRPKSTLIVP